MDNNTECEYIIYACYTCEKTAEEQRLCIVGCANGGGDARGWSDGRLNVLEEVTTLIGKAE